jgi:hypothetical protein
MQDYHCGFGSADPYILTVQGKPICYRISDSDITWLMSFMRIGTAVLVIFDNDRHGSSQIGEKIMVSASLALDNVAPFLLVAADCILRMLNSIHIHPDPHTVHVV